MEKRKNNLFKYTWPIMIESILQLLVGNVDQIMVNNFSTTAVSAIGNANQILSVLIITYTIISLAITILATQYFGSNQNDKVAQVYTLGLVVNGTFGLIVSLILLLFSKQIFILMQIPTECLADSIIYINIIAIGQIVQAVYTTYVAMFRTRGWMKNTMFISCAMNIINIIGNFILIPRFGVAGAAISSVGSRLIGLLICMYSFKMRSDIQIDFNYIKPFPNKLFQRVMQIGLPAGAESISYNMSQVVILGIINTFGNLVIKTRTFANMFAMVSYLYGSSVSQAAQIIVGFAKGANDIKEVKYQVKRTCLLSMGIGVIVSTILYLNSDFIFGLFIDDAAMLVLAKQIMFIEIFLEASRAINMTMVRSLQAVGDVKFPAGLGVVSMWLVATALSYVFGVVMGYGLVGVWFAMCLDETLRAIVFIIRWQRGKWINYQVIA